jgi:hypothetical protein
MAADCLNHSCSEREYRASITNAAVVVQKKHQTECKGITQGAMISALTDQLKKKLDDAKEVVTCPQKVCKCKMGDWPMDAKGKEIWDTLERGVTYFAYYIEPVSKCVAEVTLTYDYESREREGKCYKTPPESDKKDK